VADGKLDVFNAGERGVVITKSPIHGADGDLLKAQNAAPNPEGGLSGIRKRFGMAAVNAVAAGGAIYSIFNIPLPDPAPGAPPPPPGGGGTFPLEFLDNNSMPFRRWDGAAWTKGAASPGIWAGYDPFATGRDGTGYFVLSWAGGGAPDDNSTDGKVYRVVGDVATLFATLPVRAGFAPYVINQVGPATSNGYLCFRIQYRNGADRYYDLVVMKISDGTTTLLGTDYIARNVGSVYPFDFWPPGSIAIRHNPDTGVDDAYALTTTFTGTHAGHTIIRRRIWKAAGLTGAWTVVYDYTHHWQGSQGSIVCLPNGTLIAAHEVALTTVDAAGLHRVLVSTDGGGTWTIYTDASVSHYLVYAEAGLIIDSNCRYSVDSGQTWSSFAPAALAGNADWLNAFLPGAMFAFAHLGSDFWFWVGESVDGLFPVYKMPYASMVPEHKGNLAFAWTTLMPLE
jgi:hypothetical protein